MTVKLESLVPCPGPSDRGPCGDGVLVEPGKRCAGCRAAERGRADKTAEQRRNIAAHPKNKEEVD